MIVPKTPEELEIMIEGGKRLKRVKEALRKAVTPGVTPLGLDKMAEKLILEEGGEPSFKKVKDYYWTTCINLNDGVVHGIPTGKPIIEGDLVSVDVGMLYKGFNTDTSFTVPAGKVTSETGKFLEVGRSALKKAIDQARVGNRISDISHAMQEVLVKAGYTPVRALTGHGVGKKLHEEPQIPCFWEGSLEKGELIPERAVFAIEAIYCLGKSDLVVSGEDNWTISTKDGKIAGLFEETVAVTNRGPLVLTR